MRSLTAKQASGYGVEDDMAVHRRKETESLEQRTVAELLRENANLRRMLAKLQNFRTLAYRDALTGLWNRRYFDERLNEELSRARRDEQRRFSIMAVDVNDLKRINDGEGHAGGDRAIKWVANFLKDTLRSHDVCCRTGGDEFTVIFPELGASECPPLVARVRQQLEEANRGRENPIGLSFGTASYPEGGISIRELMDQADSAMYLDKRAQKRRKTHPMITATL
jgi:diguanylate cyclase (GGDEF)-like protein